MDTTFEKSTTKYTDSWLTPPHIIKDLGKFDLDPCASLNRPWDTATTHYTIIEDGMLQPWFGRVWLNPPYSDAAPWMAKLKEHGNGIALVFARTETKNFFDNIWFHADAVLFLKGRLSFHKEDGSKGGTAGSPSVLIAYGAENAKILKNSSLEGKYISMFDNNY